MFEVRLQYTRNTPHVRSSKTAPLLVSLWGVISGVRVGIRPQELEMYTKRGDTGGFLPAMKQLANVASLPGAKITVDTRRWGSLRAGYLLVLYSHLRK